MPVNLLRDARVTAISLVGKGANRKRYFLFKAADDEGQDVREFAHGRILKTADWSTVYCVVAEPGWHEDSGIGGPDIEDRWESPDEIRKAAHQFMENGALVNRMHEDMKPFGTVVENAVALGDFEVNGEVIKEGSWYVAIKPTPEGREAIHRGELNGVSIEGTAIREEVEKRAFTAEQRRKLAEEGKALPDGSFPIVTVADLENAISAYGRAADKEKARAHIIRRARALGATEKLPESWRVRKADREKDYLACDECMLDERGRLKRAVKKVEGRALPGLDRSPKENWVDRAGGLPDLIERAARHLHYEQGRSISAAIATAVNWAKKGCASGRAFGGKVKVSKEAQARMCKAVAEWEAKKKAAGVKKAKGHGDETAEAVDAYLAAAGSTPPSRTVGRVEKGLLRKIAEAVGIKGAELDALEAEVAKADMTFGEIIAQREFDKALPDAFDAFRDAVWRAFFPPPNAESDRDPVALISESCDEFKAWALDMLERAPVEKAERAEALGVELGPEGSTPQTRTTEDEMSLSETERQEFEDMKKQLAELPAQVSKSFAADLAKALGGKVEDEDPTPESIAKRIEGLKDKDGDDLAAEVAKLRSDVQKLAEGASSQAGGDPAPSAEDNRAAVAKAYEERGLDPALAGVID